MQANAHFLPRVYASMCLLIAIDPCRHQRYDPKAVITDIPDTEVNRGLYELVMRGLLPKSLDATPAFEGDVLALTG